MGSNGRMVGASPTTEFVKLSAASASSPAIAITATTATGGGTSVHVASANAQDVLYVQVANNSAGTLVAYGLLGTTATTSAIPLSVGSNSSAFILNAIPISGGGTFGIFTTATTGLVAYGSVQRTFV